jgi:DNA-binding MarR family transcriptional regulator
MDNREFIRSITTYQAGTVQAAMHRLLQKKSDEVLKPFGLTKMHWMIIGNVIDAGDRGIRMSDLASILGTSLPYLTKAVNLLEKQSYVLRASNEGDQRAKIITSNPAFADKYQEIETQLRQALREQIYQDIDPEEFATYIRVMYKLHDIAKRG